MAQEPVGYSGLYPNTQTKWQVANNNSLQVQVIQSGTAGPWTTFQTKGVRYEPAPLNIESGLAGQPMGDFFYIGAMPGAKNSDPWTPMLFYQPIWLRDIGPNGLIRQMGANTIAVYGTYNVPPTTLSDGGSGTPVSSASSSEEAAIDWTALGPVEYNGTTPSQMPPGIENKKAPPYWYHNSHDVFLDMCWNGGNNPIYVWLAVGMSNEVAFSANPAPADGSMYTQWQTYYENSARWMATAYANHPAVMGFIITNETNSNVTTPYKEYWDAINSINAILKKHAPDKLTMVGMQDDTPSLTNTLIGYVSVPVPGQPAPQTQSLYLQSDGSVGPTVTATPALPIHVYKPDCWGWNLYAVPNTTTPSVAYFMNLIGSQYQKPVLITETGIPAALRYTKVSGVNNGPLGGNDPYFINPNGYEAVWNSGTNQATLQLYNSNQPALGIESPPIQSTTSTERSNGNFLAQNPQFNGGGLIVYETDTTNYWLLQGNPANSSANWVQLTNSNYIPLLESWRTNGYTAPAAALGVWAGLTAMNGFMVGGSTVPSTQQIYCGVMAFEHCDEWFKWNDPSLDFAQKTLAAGVHDFRDTAIVPWGPADAQFFTTWEEEWFGLCSVLPNGRSSTDPAINTYGWLNGNGADTLKPRALYYAVQNIFNA